MKYLKVAGLALMSMLAMGMALAGNASATPLLWLLCLENVSGLLTKYNSNQCTNAVAGGHWQSLGLPSGGSDTVRILGFSVLLIDSSIGVSIHCPDIGPAWGLIENPNRLVRKVDESKAPEAEGCKVTGSFLTCKAGKLESIKDVHLPWKSETFETEGKSLASLEGTGGSPGWSITCGGATDTCEGETGHILVLELVNGVTKEVLLVLDRFESKKLNCTIGGNGSGELKGLDAILLWNGNGLSLTHV
jgi:hypothetical protein